MGYMTFAQITNSVSRGLGASINDPIEIPQYINWGLQDLCSYLKLDELKVRASFPIAAGDFSYVAPTDLIGVVTIEIGGTKLKIMHRELARGEDPGGSNSSVDFTPRKPEFYMRRGADIIVWPTPDDAYVGYIEYVKSPALWTTGVSALQPHFDVAIVRLALHHGYLIKGDADKADMYLNSAIRYINSRLEDKDFSKDNPKEGLQVAWDHSDLGIRNPPHV